MNILLMQKFNISFCN